jgi:hypothetical protein
VIDFTLAELSLAGKNSINRENVQIIIDISVLFQSFGNSFSIKSMAMVWIGPIENTDTRTQMSHFLTACKHLFKTSYMCPHHVPIMTIALKFLNGAFDTKMSHCFIVVLSNNRPFFLWYIYIQLIIS